jgi:hypothetical protein
MTSRGQVPDHPLTSPPRTATNHRRVLVGRLVLVALAGLLALALSACGSGKAAEAPRPPPTPTVGPP